MIFGERLLAWRRYRGLTQVALAKVTKIPQPSLAALEAGRFEPKLSTIQRLAGGLTISAGKLIDEYPPQSPWSRQRIDALVQEAVDNKAAPGRLQNPMAVALRMVAADKLSASGHRVALRGRTGERLVKQLRADLGPVLWAAITRRLDKLV